jgi:hypothetical protein
VTSRVIHDWSAQDAKRRSQRGLASALLDLEAA